MLSLQTRKLENNLDSKPLADIKYLADLCGRLALLHLVQERKADIAQTGRIALRQAGLLAKHFEVRWLNGSSRFVLSWTS